MESSTDKNSLLVQASRNRTLSLDSPCPVREGEGSRASIQGWYILTEEIPDNRSLRNGIDEVVKSYDRAHQIQVLPSGHKEELCCCSIPCTEVL